MRQLFTGNGFQLLKVNWKLSIKNNLILAIAYLLFIPVIRGIANLDAEHSAICLEQAVTFIGLFLFVPLSGPEQNRDIQETVISKKVSYATVLMLRLGMAIGAVVILVTAFAEIMTLLNCRFPFWKYVFGTVVSALALGTSGFCVGALWNSVISGYFVAIGYYVINIFGIGKNSKFSLFSMSGGNFETKYWLGAISILCIAAAITRIKMEKA